MRDHPLVRAKSLQLSLGYDEAEAIVRSQKDAASTQAVREIDAARDKARLDAIALNKDMAARLGMTTDQARELAGRLVADPALETWLLRRVHLWRASEGPPADDAHSENS